MWQDVRQSAICGDVISDQIRRNFKFLVAALSLQITHRQISRDSTQPLNAPPGSPICCNFVELSEDLNAIRNGHRHWEETQTASRSLTEWISATVTVQKSLSSTSFWGGETFGRSPASLGLRSSWSSCWPYRTSLCPNWSTERLIWLCIK